MKKTSIKLNLLSWTIVIIWMAVIFYLSHQTASESSELSTGFMSLMINIFSNVFPLDVPEELLHFWIRKSAHFTAYLLLGIFVIQALFRQGKWKKDSIVAIIVCVVYAISDEIHQVFIPGRSGEVRDVLIDSSGAIVGIILYIFVRLIFLRRKG